MWLRPGQKGSVRKFSIWLASPFASMKNDQHDTAFACLTPRTSHQDVKKKAASKMPL
jgi:hypothetical protein